MTAFNPNLLPDTADPEGSVRFENVNILHFIIPCHEEDVLYQWYENMLVICDCSPEHNNQTVDYFKGTVLAEADGQYSWWRNIT